MMFFGDDEDGDVDLPLDEFDEPDLSDLYYDDDDDGSEAEDYILGFGED